MQLTTTKFVEQGCWNAANKMWDFWCHQNSTSSPRASNWQLRESSSTFRHCCRGGKLARLLSSQRCFRCYIRFLRSWTSAACKSLIPLLMKTWLLLLCGSNKKRLIGGLVNACWSLIGEASRTVAMLTLQIKTGKSNVNLRDTLFNVQSLVNTCAMDHLVDMVTKLWSSEAGRIQQHLLLNLCHRARFIVCTGVLTLLNYRACVISLENVSALCAYCFAFLTCWSR